MQKITPFLWFDNQAEEAMNFYASVFPDVVIGRVNRAGENGPVFTASLRIMGQEFIVLNGGPQFKFTEALSFVINCRDQEEVDHYWEKLSEGGVKSRCGWLKDRFGLSWQVVPEVLGEIMSGTDEERKQRMMQALMRMDKLIISELQEA